MATALSYTAACIVLLTFFLHESGLSLRDVVLPTKGDVDYYVNVATRLARKGPGAAGFLPARSGSPESVVESRDSGDGEGE